MRAAASRAPSQAVRARFPCPAFRAGPVGRIGLSSMRACGVLYWTMVETVSGSSGGATHVASPLPVRVTACRSGSAPRRAPVARGEQDTRAVLGLLPGLGGEDRFRD